MWRRVSLNYRDDLLGGQFASVASSRCGCALYLRESWEQSRRVLVEDRDLVVIGQEREVADHRHEIIVRPARIGAWCATGAGCLSAEQRLCHTMLFDTGLEKDQIVRRRIVEEVVTQILLRQMAVARRVSMQRSAAMRDDHLEFGIAFEYIAML